jgi:hypothetical protein
MVLCSMWMLISSYPSSNQCCLRTLRGFGRIQLYHVLLMCTCWSLHPCSNSNSDNRNKPGGDVHDMFLFNEIIGHLGLLEIPLKGRRFTWSNMQSTPLLE